MKLIACLILAVLALSCTNLSKGEYYVRFTGRVEIVYVNIPDTIDNMEYTPLPAKAQAYNSCWSNLNFIMTKNSTFEYTIEAFGSYESTGTCNELMVYGDTTLLIQPTQPGLYRFTILKSQDVTEIDTLIVR